MNASCLHCHGQAYPDPALGWRCIQCGRSIEPDPPRAPGPQREVRMLVNGTGQPKPSARLTERQRRDIAWKRQQHVPIREIASEYGIAERTVSRITLAERFDRAVEQLKERA